MAVPFSDFPFSDFLFSGFPFLDLKIKQRESPVAVQRSEASRDGRKTIAGAADENDCLSEMTVVGRS